ncbi:hypothetical protein GOP47_0014307 [Adiantum capillus-veneris]|uniref:Uncharacterized protein n=1 Tax=Adiantum capillus-veneris TaxID=13818 RepID=A0A9D4UL88_ADICA|nr:hypothetical protein GOP47_0014307 [Adiantum capillus-veneris]
MFLVPDCFTLPRRFLISFFFVCQLTWILPCIFFLLQPSVTSKLSIIQSQNATRLITSKGFAGPLRVLGNGDLFLLETIHDAWSTLWPTLQDEYIANGLNHPPKRTCFIWLAECYNLAKHEHITQIVKEAIGPNVLLYGMTIWDREHQVLQKFHRDTDLEGCPKSLSFVSGTSVQLISHSHKISNRLLQVVLKLLAFVDGESIKSSGKEQQAANFDKLFATRVKRFVKTADIQFESFEAADGYGVFIRGGTVFRVGEVIEGERGLLLQFVSADCKIRESQKASWGVQGTSYSLFMPPVLLVTGAITKSSQFNDVRLTLVKKETMNVKTGRLNILGSSLNSEKKLNAFFGSSRMYQVMKFSEANASGGWQGGGIWRFQKVGEASTAVMLSGKIEQFRVSKRLPSTKFHNVASVGQQVIVVLREGLLYSRLVINGEHCYSEVLELRPGSSFKCHSASAGYPFNPCRSVLLSHLMEQVARFFEVLQRNLCDPYEMALRPC